MGQRLDEAKSSGAPISGRMLRSARRAGAVAAFLLLAACGTSTPAAQVPGRAGLIVGLSDGSFTTTCVTFEGSGFSGEDLLRQSGLPVTLDAGNALGTLVCSIAEEGCRFPDEACLCRCRGAGPCSYWAYFNWDDEDGWTYAVQGARLRQVQDGDLDAWIWLDRSLPSDELPLPPSDLTFDSICG
ncbi:MAG: hypothetical protein HW375_499 [Anaerolineales bacterium]|nr:hypothetical protein [Anaerolineales bacterium]